MQLPQYIQSLLGGIAQREGFATYKYEVESGSKHGDNFIAVLTAITLTGNRVQNGEIVAETLNLLCKTIPQNKQRRITFQSIPAFKREIFMYTRVLPLFVAFQKEKGLTADESFLSFPKVYASICDEAADQFALIMEDLRPKKFVMWPRQEPITLEHEELLLKQLGRLHGISFALKDQRPEEFAEFKKLNDVVFGMIEIGYARNVIDDCLERAVKVLTNDGHKKEIDKFQHNYFDTYKAFFAEGANEKFGVVNHGDCWVNNFLYQYREEVWTYQICRYAFYALIDHFFHSPMT